MEVSEEGENVEMGGVEAALRREAQHYSLLCEVLVEGVLQALVQLCEVRARGGDRLWGRWGGGKGRGARKPE